MYLNYLKRIALLFFKCINLLNALQLLFTYEFFPFCCPLGCSNVRWRVVIYLGTDVGALSEAQPFPGVAASGSACSLHFTCNSSEAWL